MLTYLAKCPGSSCTGVNANSLSWFKIDQSGLISGTVGNGVWGSGLMIQQNNSWTSTIPSTVPAGAYLIRFETIALHSMPAQFYPECAQLQITGGGTREPTSSELVKFPGAYKASDPGVTVDLYTQQAQTQTQYIIPGPPLYGSGLTPTQPSQPPASTAAPPASSPPVQTVAPSPGTVNQYGQCGGIGYSGPTGCVAPFTCNKVNDYYSQCL
ncbi:hypothetical protein HGRIS_003170 [Hohenbuehelia grisea]|uniref:lytic cellulose monooxygenase (C4-dehydrogenating) n=1 Tax=Hohenbuehelia grisea TaxID=104357 RepID=A0ABR3JNX3_9AGAR